MASGLSPSTAMAIGTGPVGLCVVDVVSGSGTGISIAVSGDEEPSEPGGGLGNKELW